MSGSITDIKGITVGHYTDKKAKPDALPLFAKKGRWRESTFAAVRPAQERQTFYGDTIP